MPKQQVRRTTTRVKKEEFDVEMSETLRDEGRRLRPRRSNNRVKEEIQDDAVEQGHGQDEVPQLVAAAAPNAGLWFKDGSVVIRASDGGSFKLHEGVLSRQSRPLGALIAAARSDIPAEDALQDGLVVRLPDKAEGLVKFFEIIYDGAQHAFFDRSKRIEFRELRAVLLLAIKYEVQYIVTYGMALLKECFPNDLNFLPEYREEEPPVAMSEPDAIAVVHLARATGNEAILPTVFYACTGLPPTVIVNGIKYGDDEVKLSYDDQMVCLEAIPKLLKMTARIIEVFMDGSLHELQIPCDNYHPCRNVFHYLATQAIKEQIHVTTRCFRRLYPWADEELEDIELPLCLKCDHALDLELTMAAHTAWEELGELFGIANWDPNGLRES